MKRFVMAIVAALIPAVAAVASPDGTHTLAPGENKSIYEFGNLTGSLTINADQSVNIRWISAGEKKEIEKVSGWIEVRLPKKLDGRLEASNPNGTPATVRVTENTQASNLSETWERFWATASGGPNSEINQLHRKFKRIVKKAFK